MPSQTYPVLSRAIDNILLDVMLSMVFLLKSSALNKEQMAKKKNNDQCLLFGFVSTGALKFF